MSEREARFLYDQVFDLVFGQIRAGSIQPGDRLPSLRRMSGQLKVSVATVMQGYMNLEREGLISARPQSGFFVNSYGLQSAKLPSPTSPRPVARDFQLSNLVHELLRLSRQPGMIPFGLANPAQELLPARSLNRALHRVANRNPEAAVDYMEPAGDGELRRQIAYRSSTMGTVVDPEEIIVTNGASEALALSLRSLTRPGDTVAVESPAYFFLLQLIENLGLKAIEVPSDPVTGLNIDAFEDILGHFEVSVLMVVANFNNPYGSLMPDIRKQRLVELVNRKGVRLIEDDIYGDLHFGPYRPRPLRSFDTSGNVVSCCSFSKTLAPGYRVGWLVADRDRSEMLSRKQSISMSSCSVTQMATAEFLASGSYERHLRRLRSSFKQQVEKMRHQLSLALPGGTRISQPQGGFVLWVELPRGTDANQLFRDCLEQNLSILPGSIFSPTRKFRNCIRISCGHPWSDVMSAGVAKLAELTRRNLH